MAINFPDPSQQTTYVADSGVTYEFIDGVWKATTFAGLGDVRYVNSTGDDMSGNLTIATDKISLNTDGSASFAGTVDANALTVDGAAVDTSAEVDAKVATKTTEAYVNQQIAAIPPTDLSAYDTSAEVTAKVAALETSLTDGAPGALDTLNELAASLGDDSNFAGTVTNSLAGKADLSGATFTGDVTASAFIGDGSQLTGVGSETIISSTPPTPADYEVGTMWWNSDSTDTALYILYQDPTGPNGDAGGKYWVEAAPAPDSIGFNGSHTGDSTFSGDMTVIGGGTFTENVGIGTTSPGARLHLAGGGGMFIQDTTGTERTTQILQSGNSLFVDIRDNASDGQLVIRGKGGGSASEFVRIDTSGNVGIGESSPSSYDASARNLVIKGSTNAGMTIRSATNKSGVLYFADGTTGNEAYRGRIEYNHTDDKLQLGTAGTGSKVVIDSAGRVGIGTSSINSSARLDIDAGALPIGINLDSTNAGGMCNVFKHSGVNKLTIGTGGSSFLTGSSTADGLIRAEANLVIAAGGNTEQMRIDSAGRLLVGTTTEGHSDADNLTIADSSKAGITIRNTNTAGAGAIFFSDATSGSAEYAGYVEYRHNNDQLVFATASTEQMRIDSEGRVGIGTISPDTLLGLQNNTNDSPTLSSSWANSGYTSSLRIKGYKDNLNNQAEHHTIVHNFANSENNGYIGFCRGDSVSGGFLTFGTDGSERMRIDSAGRLLVGTDTSVGSALLQIQGDANNSIAGASFYMRRGEPASSISSGELISYMGFADNGGGTFGAIRCDADGNASSGSYPGRLSFLITANGAASPTERMRISSGGVVSLTQNQARFALSTQTGMLVPLTIQNSGNNTSATLVQFTGWNGSVIGSISGFVNQTTYATSSDYRLKENVVDLTNATDSLKQLRPKRFNFIENPDLTLDGFLAHEAQQVVSNAVTGEHDEIDQDGEPVYQGMDYSKLVPLLTAALQEAIAKIETLAAEVAALKAS